MPSFFAGKNKTARNRDSMATGASQTPLSAVNRDPLSRSNYPNKWSRFRTYIRAPAAEFLGTMILVLFGTAGNAQGTLFNSTKVSASPAGGWLSVAIGWGLGLGMGAWISAGVSGGHINPAITIAMALIRDFPWRMVPVYIFSQLLGGIVGAAITYANYFHAIDLFEGGPGIRTVPGTASIFGTYAAPFVTNVSAWFDEFIGTFLLVIVMLAVTDNRNGAPPSGLQPLALFLVLFGIGMCFGPQTGFAVNPARDLGPRILTAMVGYGKEVFNFRHQYWIWCPVLAPVCGALVATFIYDTFLFAGMDSILNRRSSFAKRVDAHHEAKQEQKEDLTEETERPTTRPSKGSIEIV